MRVATQPAAGADRQARSARTAMAFRGGDECAAVNCDNTRKRKSDRAFFDIYLNLETNTYQTILSLAISDYY